MGIMGMLLIGMALLSVWLYFAVQEPDCAEVRRRPAREYVESAPSQPTVIKIDRQLTASEFERVRELWGDEQGTYGGVVVWDGDGFREEIRVWTATPPQPSPYTGRELRRW